MKSNVISFDKMRKAAQKSKALGLCQHGFHKWQVCKEKQFDPRKGKLVTVLRCSRCGQEKVKLL